MDLIPASNTYLKSFQLLYFFFEITFVNIRFHYPQAYSDKLQTS